uniref:Uncharacterized protein n=1 Tax=Chenopodium quinoa TaxID=63459 RepID=A0A803NC49_CHEQI
MINCKLADTPMIMNHGLQIIEGLESVNQTQYQRLVGKLIYLSHTRPDLAYAVGVVSRFMYKPQKQHLKAVYRILRYLKKTPGRGVLYENHGHLDLHAFTDADLGGDRDSRKSTSGYFTLVGGNLVSWKSKRQKKVSMSSAEAEFRGIAKGITEVLWLGKLLSELGYTPKKSCKLYCDNMAAIRISENPVQHDRTKHVEIDRHFIKDNLEAKLKIRFQEGRDKHVLTAGASFIEAMKLDELLLEWPSSRRIPAADTASLTNVIIESSSSLRRLKLRGCHSLKDVSPSLENFHALEELEIDGCEELNWEDLRDINEGSSGDSAGAAWQGLKSLRSLTLTNISKPEPLPRGLGCYRGLKELFLLWLYNMIVLPESIGCLSQLDRLVIRYCPKLNKIPECFPNLKSFNISLRLKSAQSYREDEKTSEASSKDEELKQMQKSVDKLTMEKKMWEVEKQKLMKQVSEEKQKLKEQVTMEKKMWEEEKQKLEEQVTTEKKMWEEEKLSLTEQVEEARARIELYSYEMIYHKKLSKLEEQVKNMEEERQELMKKNLVVEEYKVYEQNVGEEFKVYQQNWECERYSLKSQIDHLFNVIAKYEELNNRQQYMISLLSAVTDQYRHNAANQSTEETSYMSPDY